MSLVIKIFLVLAFATAAFYLAKMAWREAKA